jgi:alpha/beta superfamily hydrolase
MHAELVRTVTRDGLRLDGALFDPAAAAGTENRPRLARGVTAAILLHGVGGNFYSSSTFEPLIPQLRDAGIAVLTVNTRGHDSVFGAMLGNVRRRMGAAYETVDDCRLDVAAWVTLLSSRGHTAVALIGHSLGAIKAVYSQALEKLPQIATVVAVSPPRLSYSAFMNAPESSQFFESFSTAERMVAEGRGDDLFTGKFPVPLLVTASGYIDKYGPAERYNILKFAHEVPCPALFVYGTKELDQGGIAFAGLPDALMLLDGADHRHVITIDGADHFYAGLAEQLANQITDWLAQL